MNHETFTEIMIYKDLITKLRKAYDNNARPNYLRESTIKIEILFGREITVFWMLPNISVKSLVPSQACQMSGEESY